MDRMSRVNFGGGPLIVIPIEIAHYWRGCETCMPLTGDPVTIWETLRRKNSVSDHLFGAARPSQPITSFAGFLKRDGVLADLVGPTLPGLRFLNFRADRCSGPNTVPRQGPRGVVASFAFLAKPHDV